jgi:hypothetical protein
MFLMIKNIQLKKMSLQNIINSILGNNYKYISLGYNKNGTKCWKKFNKFFTIIYYDNQYVIIDKRKPKHNIYNSKSAKNIKI